MYGMNGMDQMYGMGGMGYMTGMNTGISYSRRSRSFREY